MIEKFYHHELRGHRIRVLAFTGVCFVTANAELQIEPTGYLIYIERAHEEGREIIFDAVREEEYEDKRHRKWNKVIRYLINLKEGQ